MFENSIIETRLLKPGKIRHFTKNFLLVLFLSFIFWSCKTTSALEKHGITPENPYIIEEELDFEEVDAPYKYVFFRLYNPVYTNPFYIANLLKFGIKATQISELQVSHASINFSLDDNFWGLALNSPQNCLSQETCTDISTNEFMSRCNPYESEQTTYAIRVKAEEYENIKTELEEYAQLKDIRYKTSINFKFALFSMERKFFTPKSKQTFGNIKYHQDTEKDRLEFDPSYTENDFVCSTFIAYLLNKNIASVNQYFNEHNVNYRYVNVCDIPDIPGVTKLFYSSWDNYTLAAQAFVDQNEEFREYFK